MKFLVIYTSVHHGNTEKVARAIAEELNADLMEAGKAEVEKLAEYDVIGFGSGIYFLKHHKSLIDFVEKLPELNKKAFIFSTRGGTPVFINHRVLKRKLRSKELKIIGEFSCKGYDTYGLLKLIGGINKGKPGEKEIERARKFARKIMKEASN